MANEKDITIGLSRRWCDIANVLNIKVDLLDKEQIKRELLGVLSSLNIQNISSIHVIHTASKIKNELQGVDDVKYNTIDLDGDGIDDEVLHCTYTTFKNTHEALLECLQIFEKDNLPKYINIVGTLLDKKLWIPSSHASMIKTNNLLRDYVKQICEVDKSYKVNCVSVGTIATESELSYRKNWEHDYWLKEKTVVDSILERNIAFVSEYTDEDRYEHNPRYVEYYKDETDEQMTKRFMREIPELNMFLDKKDLEFFRKNYLKYLSSL
jgi:hypothetical protein